MIARALTVAGSDPTGGAGLQQDLAVFGALGVWGLSAATAITAQSTMAMLRWEPVAPDMIRAQIDAVVNDVGVDAMKTGMLGTAEAAMEVERAVATHSIGVLVIDPVLRAGAGASLSEADLLDAIRERLVPRATLVTPNAEEAMALTGIDVLSRDDQERAARAVVALGARAALVKGGHVPGDESVDVLVVGDQVHELRAPRASTGEVHGTGCVLSAAITASLANGKDVVTAVHEGKAFLTAALQRTVKLGGGALVIRAR